MQLPPRLALARTPTPIQPLARLSAGRPAQLWIWRDDLTGCVLSGNKIRKLEFLLADARAQGATAVVTCGGLQSNHVRATALAARRLGLQAAAVLRTPAGGESLPVWNGNSLLVSMAGTCLREISHEEFEAAGRSYDGFVGDLAERLRSRGQRPYCIPEGGSNALGALGYHVAVSEMLAEWRRVGPGTAAPDAIFTALGSGGTHAGLLLGCEAAGVDPRRVQAVNVCDDKSSFERRVGDLVRGAAARYGLAWSGAPLQIHDGHVGRGYGCASDDDLRFYAEVAAAEGVVLDPCYTGKAMRGMLAEIEAGPSRFGRHVLFLHSGGVYETFAYAYQYQRALGSSSRNTELDSSPA